MSQHRVRVGSGVALLVLALLSTSCARTVAGSGRVDAAATGSAGSGAGSGSGRSSSAGSDSPSAPPSSSADGGAGGGDQPAGSGFCGFMTARDLQNAIGGPFTISSGSEGLCIWNRSPKQVGDNSGSILWTTYRSVADSLKIYKDNTKLTIDGHPGAVSTSLFTDLFVSTGNDINADGSLDLTIYNDQSSTLDLAKKLASAALKYAAAHPR